MLGSLFRQRYVHDGYLACIYMIVNVTKKAKTAY